MATVLDRYREICERHESSKHRNSQMKKDAIRLKKIFKPVNTERLEELKRQYSDIFHSRVHVPLTKHSNEFHSTSNTRVHSTSIFSDTLSLRDETPLILSSSPALGPVSFSPHTLFQEAFKSSTISSSQNGILASSFNQPSAISFPHHLPLISNYTSTSPAVIPTRDLITFPPHILKLSPSSNNTSEHSSVSETMELECQMSTDQNVSTLQPPFLHSPITPLARRQSDLKVTMDKEKDEHKDDNEIINGGIVNEEENIEQRKDKQQDEIKEWKKEQENIEEESKEAIKNYEKEERKLQEDEEEEKDTDSTNEQDETREKEVERFEKEKTEGVPIQVDNKNLDSDEESVQSLLQNRLEDAIAKDQLSTENLQLDQHRKEEKLTETDETLYPISTLRPDTHIQLPLDNIERLKPPVMNEELKLSEFQKLDKEEDKTEEEEEYKEEEEEDKEEEKEEEEEEEEDKDKEEEEVKEEEEEEVKEGEGEEDKDKEEEEEEVKEEEEEDKEEEEEDKEGEEEEDKQKIKTRTDNECLEKVNKVKEIVMQEEEDEQSEDFWNVSPTHKPYQYDKTSMEHSETIDKGDSDESVSSSISSSSIPPKNYPQVLAGLTCAINTQIRKDRELAKRLYATPCLTDNMREQIQHSPVLLSLLTKRARWGQDISTWDTSALAMVLMKVLSDITANHGSPSLNEDVSSDKDSPWYSLWPLILEHMRLLFQCGESLESIALAFSSTLGVEENNILNVLQQECGVESLQRDESISPLITPSSSSISLPLPSDEHEDEKDGDIPLTGTKLYRSFTQSLLQSSHDSDNIDSLSEDSAIAALQVNMGHKLINNLRKDKDTEEGNDTSLSLPISDTTPPKQSTRPVNESVLSRRMGFWDEEEEVGLNSHMSVPTNDDDDFEFYQ